MATNDDYIKEFNVVVLKAILEDKKVYSLIHSGALRLDVYTPPQDTIQLVYVYLTKKVIFSKLVKYSSDLIFAL